MGRPKASEKKLTRLTCIRAGLKENLRGLFSRLREELDKDSPDKVQLSIESDSLLEKEKKLRALNEEIQDLLEEDDLTQEVIVEEEYLDQLVMLRMRAKTLIGGRKVKTSSRELSTSPAPSVVKEDSLDGSDDAASVRSQVEKSSSIISLTDARPQSTLRQERPSLHRKSHIVKPTITMKKFSGSWADWPEFWDGFVNGIDSDDALNDSEKLNYLKSLLEKEALDTIRGVRLIDASYGYAVDTLKRKYGRTDVILSNHVNALLRLPRVERANDTHHLRKLFEKVEFHVRGIESFGKTAETYDTIVVPFLLTRLPEEIILQWNRQNPSSIEVSLCSLLEFLRIETEAREKTTMEGGNNDSKKDRNVDKKLLPSAAALTSSSQNKNKEIKNACGFCKKADCSPIRCAEGLKLSVPERSQRLKENGGCYCCLQKGHMSSACDKKDSLICNLCKGKHHTLLHNSFTKATTAAATTNTQEGTLKCAFFKTAKALLIKENSEPKKVRVLFDGASDRCWIRDKVARKLTPIGYEQLNVQGFGGKNTDSKNKVFEIELRSIFNPDEPGVTITALGTGKIVNPLAKYNVSRDLLDVPFSQFGKENESICYLSELELAEEIDCQEEIEIDILIGIEHEWDFYLERVLKPIGKESPALLETKLGWVLTGSMPRARNAQAQQALSLINVTNQELNDNLKKFWELESLGIQPSEEKTVDEDDQLAIQLFKENLKFTGDCYEVALPIPKGKEVLMNNRESAVKRLQQQEKRMERDPSLKKAYIDTMEEYLREGWAEESPA